MDPRAGTLLLQLAERHRITLSSTTSDHPQGTAGGSTSNHWLGRAFDIATVDGEIVRPDSAAARKLADELSAWTRPCAPTRSARPGRISAPGYFTDGDHQDHLHIGFKVPIARDWEPPNDARVMPALRPDQLDDDGDSR